MLIGDPAEPVKPGIRPGQILETKLAHADAHSYKTIFNLIVEC
jgi:hypothetical protein